jgi:hypothetical protein
MKKLREILETVRSSERAHKLLDYIQKRWHNHYNDIKAKNDWRKQDYENYHHTKNSYDSDIDFIDGKKQKVRIKDLKILQKTVTPGHVKTVMDKKTDPIKVVKMDGQLYVLDGHHRYFAAKIRGDKHIEATVKTMQLSNGQRRRKRLFGSIDQVE